MTADRAWAGLEIGIEIGPSADGWWPDRLLDGALLHLWSKLILSGADWGASVTRKQVIVLASVLAMAPLGAEAADLVVWWNEGYYAQEGEAVREIIAAFEERTGKQVELVLHPEQELPDEVVAAVEAGEPPDFAFSILNIRHSEQWAYEGRLVDLTDAIGHFADLFDRDALDAVTLLDATTGRRGSTCCRWGLRPTMSTPGRACSSAPASRSRTSQEWGGVLGLLVRPGPAGRARSAGPRRWLGVGLTMSVDSIDTVNGFWQFADAYEADYVTRDGRLVIDDPEVRRRLIKALDGYTAVYRKGCTPPDSVNWTNRGNNVAFLEQSIVLTLNQTSRSRTP